VPGTQEEKLGYDRETNRKRPEYPLLNMRVTMPEGPRPFGR